MCPSPSWLISPLIRSRIYTVFALNRQSRFNFSYRYIDDVLSINNPEFENNLGQLYPVGLDAKDTTDSNVSLTLLFLTEIYFGRSGGTANFIIPFMTNVTISISISQIFRFWVAIFQVCPPMTSLSHSYKYDMAGLVPRMNVLFWGQHDFQISFLNRDASRNVWNCHWRSFMVDTAIWSNNTKFLSHEC